MYILQCQRWKHPYNVTFLEYISLKQEYDRKADSYQKELEELVREEQDFSKTISPQNYWIKALKKCQAEEKEIYSCSVRVWSEKDSNNADL